jgi:hypothetical protein
MVTRSSGSWRRCPVGERPKGYPATPVLDTLKSVKPEADVIARFLEWAEERRWEFCQPHACGEGCQDDEGEVLCHAAEGERLPVNLGIEKVLAKYLGVDLDAADREKCAVLDWHRKQEASRV